MHKVPNSYYSNLYQAMQFAVHSLLIFLPIKSRLRVSRLIWVQSLFQLLKDITVVKWNVPKKQIHHTFFVIWNKNKVWNHANGSSDLFQLEVTLGELEMALDWSCHCDIYLFKEFPFEKPFPAFWSPKPSPISKV